MLIKKFVEFKCSNHGYGWLKKCPDCVMMNNQFYQYYDLEIQDLQEHKGAYLFPLCKICGMRYVHDMNHSGVDPEVWGKDWEKILVK